jgi:hypothetical protein
MRTPLLWSRFQELHPTADAGVVTAVRCGTSNQHLLVRGEHGEPALLLATESRTSPRPDIRLKHVGVQFDRRFEVAHDDGGATEVGNFCKVACDPSQLHLHQYFVELMAATASTHMGVLSPQTTDEVVDVLLELFRRLSPPADYAVTGLWGELLLMHLAASPGQFVDAWHLKTTDGFDFSFADKRIEVKTTARPSREHEFSLDQVRGRPSDLVASITLSRSSAGLSALDLARLIAERLSARQQGKLWCLVIEALGDDAGADGEERFDLKSASDRLRFVRAGDVPAPDVSARVVPFVSDVRFRSNINVLCATSAIDKSGILGAGHAT